MTPEQIPITQDGYDRLSIELTQLKKVERPKVIEDISEARAHGDLKENAEYHAAKEKQALIEGRIAELDDKLARAMVITHEEKAGNTVKFGAYVKLSDEETGGENEYQVVGDIESDLANGKVSLSSPIAKALLGRKLDDLIVIRAPKGKRECVIVGIRYD